ncbi:MAG: hypothetical protein JXR76_02010 [Deltaproteobacteria bacterium]|nr:hypothetical protein [Deltaproteobacteria bacterium]
MFSGKLMPFPYSLKLEGWTIENRGVEIGHIPPTAKVGMDIYIWGQVSPKTDIERDKILEYWATTFARHFKPDAAIFDM